jgi:L-rhamnose mutarotase
MKSHLKWVTVAGIAAAVICLMLYTTACDSSSSTSCTRYGSVIGLRADKLVEYKALHAAIWPQVSRMIRECHIRNYSIYLQQMDDGSYCLFSYFEYTGQDFKADMAKMAADPQTQKWWKVTDPCQFALQHRKSGEWWAGMEEVFHQN